jgi:hypothetical protein
MDPAAARLYQHGESSPKFEKFAVLFPVSREFSSGDGFENDCVRHHGGGPPINGPSANDTGGASDRDRFL